MRSLRTSLLAAFLLPSALTLWAPLALGAQGRDRDLITRAEIERSAQRDADIHSVIRALRPHFLRMPRGVRTLGNGSISMALFVDGMRESSFDVLKGIPASGVLEVRYQDPSTAASDHGQEANGGAVLVRRMKPAAEPAPSPPGH